MQYQRKLIIISSAIIVCLVTVNLLIPLPLNNLLHSYSKVFQKKSNQFPDPGFLIHEKISFMTAVQAAKYKASLALQTSLTNSFVL